MQTLSNAIQQEAEAILAPEERQLCEVWTRVMGYHRPVSSFNRGKQGEFHERKCFCEPQP
jgi:hypothetical protein